MRIFSIVCFFHFSFNLFASAAPCPEGTLRHQYCSDGNTSITICSSNYGAEVADDPFRVLPDEATSSSPIAFANKALIVVQTPEKTYRFDRNITILTDVAGQFSYQVLAVDGLSYKFIVNLHYDHEEGFLQGHVLPPVFASNGDFQYFSFWKDRLEFGESMRCGIE